jgi:hypothetical protein
MAGDSRRRTTAVYDMTHFTLRDMTSCETVLRTLGKGAQSLPDVARRIVHHLYEYLRDVQTGERACALVRFYKTQAFGSLDAALQHFARRVLAGEPESPAMRCLTLMATVGERPEWNATETSVGHQAIPLPSPQFVSQVPMIANLIRQFGLDIDMVLTPDPQFIMELEQKTYNVFHVQQAVGSSYIPAQQEFVIPFGIHSVLGFGGMLPSGNLFVVILFSKVPIPRETADLFKPLSLSVKLTVLPFEEPSLV